MDDTHSALTELVARSSLFSVLPGEALASVASRLEPQRVDHGTYLFHAEQAADRLYLVAQGELEVVRVSEGGKVDRLNTVTEGEIVGELAVLRGALRSASVRAQGRTLVYWMHAADFMKLVHRWPTLAIEVARRVASNFVSSERRWHGEERPGVWCVHASLPRGFVDALTDAAALHLEPQASDRVVVLTREHAEARTGGGFTVQSLALEADPDARLGVLVREVERSALVVIYGAREDLTWALADADALIVGDGAPRIDVPVSTRRVEITRHGLPSRSRIKARRGAPLSSVAPRLARNLLGQSVGLALGGGGALGYAHLGVIEVLEQLGVGIDYVLGTSMGAVIGGAYLCLGAAALRARVEQMSRPIDWMTVVDPGVMTSGVLSGRRALRFLVDLLKTERFDQLCTPFAAVALDLDAAEERVLAEGSLPDAIRASLAIPGVFMPHSYDSPFGPHARFVDGCMINNVPVDSVRAMGADRVIGVHVMARDGRPTSAGRSRRPWSRRLPGLSGLARLQTAAQTYIVALARSGERQVYMADVGILPDTSGFSLYEFWRGGAIADRGRAAAREAADRLEVLGPRAIGRAGRGR